MAAVKWRLMQARTLIRSVKVEIRVGERVVSAISYLRDPNCAPKEQGYQRITKIAMDTTDSRAAFQAELGRALPILRRLRDIAAILGHSDEVEQIMGQLAGLRTAIEEPEAACRAAWSMSEAILGRRGRARCGMA